MFLISAWKPISNAVAEISHHGDLPALALAYAASRALILVSLKDGSTYWHVMYRDFAKRVNCVRTISEGVF